MKTYIQNASNETLKVWAENFEYFPDEDIDERTAEVATAKEIWDECTERGIDAENLFNEFKTYGFNLERSLKWNMQKLTAPTK